MKNSDTLESLVQENLNDGETVLWSGKPVGIKLLEAPYGSPIIIRWVVCLIFACVAIWYGLIFVPGSASIDINSNVIMLVFLIIAVLVAVRPIMGINQLNKKYVYYITNQRALILIKGVSNTVKQKPLTDAPEITTEMISEGRGNIFIGNMSDDKLKKARYSVLTPVQSEEDIAKPMVFYSVANPDEVISCFPAQNDSK